MVPEFFTRRQPHLGMTPEEYRHLLELEAARAEETADADKNEHTRHLPLNLARTKRIEKSFRPDVKVRMAAQRISAPQLWMLLTEPWCGDSAQNLPCLAKIAACNPLIDLRILLRDQNPDIMDAYLTNGARSIPKLVVFDLQGRELFRWGPRPQPAAELFRQLRAGGTPLEDLHRKLHLWYGRNRGRALEEEILVLLQESDRKNQ